MNLEQFKKATLGGSFGNPKTGTFKGECVSYARKYMEEVLGISTYPDGHAKNYWNNSISQNNFDKVPTPRDGDIVVYGEVPSNKYGHIGIVYNGQLLSQNADIPLHVSITSLNYVKNRLGYLRKKGVQVDKFNEGDRYNLLAWTVGKKYAEQAKVNNYFGQEIGKPYKQAVETILQSTQYKGWVKESQNPGYLPYNGKQLFVKE